MVNTAGLFKYLRNCYLYIIFASLFLIGLLIYRDYGSYWDEPRDVLTGVTALKYVLYNDQELFTYRDRHYGTAFQLPLAYALHLFKPQKASDIYYIRHVLTFLLFFISSIYFYRLINVIFQSSRLALFGLLMLLLSPRIFADAFYNSKDIALMSAFIIAFYYLVQFITKPRPLNMFLSAISAAFATDIRMAGLIIPAITVLYFPFKTSKIYIFLYPLVFIFFMVLFWPYLWKDSWNNFIQALEATKGFQAYGGTVFYMGDYISSKNTPWHYLPVWLLITTPIVYTLLFIAGIIGLRNKTLFIFILWILLPYLLVLVYKSELYDGWRHFYFIYPAFIIVAVNGLNSLWARFSKFRALMILIILFALFNILRFMAVNHPYQHLYFNTLAGGMERAKQNFELDYWGLTFRRGFEYIAKNDSSPVIPYILLYGSAGHAESLPQEDLVRFRYIYDENKIDGVKYILTNYRWHRKDYQGWQEIFSTKIDNEKIMSVFKVN